MLATLPQPHELDPTFSANHRKLLRLRAKARQHALAGVRARQHDPTLRLVDTGKTTSSPLQPDRIDPGIGQAERQEAAGEHQEADPYQGEGQGRSVSPRGEEDDNSNVG